MNKTEKTKSTDFISRNVENSEEFETDGELICEAGNTVLCNIGNSMGHYSQNCKVIESERKTIKRLSNSELLNKYVSENGEDFETDGKELFCKICKKNISFDTKHSVYRHLKSKKHNKILNDSLSIEVHSKPKKTVSLIGELLNKYVAENAETFETDGELLLCKLCKKSVSFDKKSSIERHLKTQKHLYCYAQKLDKPHLPRAKENLLIWEKNEDFCRTCMKQFSAAKEEGNKQSIAETPAGYQNHTSVKDILEIIQPQIKVELEANLPTLICSDCIQKLMVSYNFIEMYQTVDKKLRKMSKDFVMIEPEEQLEEMEVLDGFELDKYELEIEQVNIDEMAEEELQSDNEWPEFKKKPEQNIVHDEENNETAFSNSYSDASDDDWIPKKDCLKVAPKNQNSDDVTKNIFKGFSQPDKNNDGSLTCLLCNSILEGVLPWREHIRQNHLEEKPRRAYNKRKSKPNEKEPQKARRRIQPNEDGLYKCEYCEKSYPRYIFYRRHLRVHTREPHLCIECGKSFPLLSSYTSHMLRHKGEKNFKCPHCPKSFVCSSGLYNHAITHTNNKPYVCDICGSAFHMAYQLKKHNRIHTGVKKYQCEYCDMKFITGEKQRRHMRTHTGEKPYRCKYCERAFAQSNDCVKHLRQHLGHNVYQCDLCPLRFPLLRELRVHFASHKDDDEETRTRNLQARKEAEKNLQIKLGSRESV